MGRGGHHETAAPPSRQRSELQEAASAGKLGWAGWEGPRRGGPPTGRLGGVSTRERIPCDGGVGGRTPRPQRTTGPSGDWWGALSGAPPPPRGPRRAGPPAPAPPGRTETGGTRWHAHPPCHGGLERGGLTRPPLSGGGSGGRWAELARASPPRRPREGTASFALHHMGASGGPGGTRLCGSPPRRPQKGRGPSPSIVWGGEGAGGARFHAPPPRRRHRVADLPRPRHSWGRAGG